MAIGDRIKDLREKRGQSLQEVADAVKASKAHIWELERNRSTNPSLDLLQKLARHFSTSVTFLIEEPKPGQSRAEQFYSKNSEKFASLSDQDFDAFEKLLDVLATKREAVELSGEKKSSPSTD